MQIRWLFKLHRPRQLYKYQLENLTFSSVYKVGIRASNLKGMRESELFWKTFTVPSCVEWHNYNFNICAPEAPQNLQVEQIIVDQHIYSLNISWLLPKHLPDNYTLRIQDLSDNGKTTNYELAKDIHNLFIPQIHFHGVFYEVSLTAYTVGGHTTTTYTDITKTVIHIPEKNPFVKLIAVILAPIFCVAILSLTIFIIYHRRAKLKRYQARCKYFEELEKKAPIDPKNDFNFTTNLTTHPNDFPYQIEGAEHLLYDDDMEIDSNNLILYQVLGEGAFGLVKLGLYKDTKLGITQQVAVKMLKDHPSADDIYAFRREIEVMKSVEKHPNIVGIIGHCTRFSHQMMLITEYCSFGNLLNFLRDEWHFLHKLQMKKLSINTNISYNDLTKEDNTSQELKLPTVDEDISERNHRKHVVKNDRTTDNINNDFIQHFQIKYNEINMPATKASVINNNGNSNNNNDAMQMNQTLFQHFDELKATATASNEKTEMYHPNHTRDLPSTASAAAADNKSYGYHGFCTNSCKCNVDVIKENIDTETDAEKQNEKLQHVLNEQQLTQQLHEQQQQRKFYLNKSCTDTTTIRIKNCDCKMKEKYQNSINKFSGVVENKSYFNLFTWNNKYLTPTIQRNIQLNKLKSNNKSQSLTEPKMDFSENHNDDNGNVDVQNDCKDIDMNRVPLTCGDLLYIARQVAVGMEFLAKNKVVHRDLAARNCLVSPDRTIKIADFGLSRDVYQENMYKKSGNGKLPIKWLALESMTHQVYTTQSDVWSFGILLYEIVTLGATPYPSVPTNRLLDLLKSGYRMEKPKGCSQELYNLMYSCWNAEPITRPTFNNIILKLDEMLNDLDSPKESSTFYSAVIKHLSSENKSVQNGSSDESYLKPL